MTVREDIVAVLALGARDNVTCTVQNNYEQRLQAQIDEDDACGRHNGTPHRTGAVNLDQLLPYGIFTNNIHVFQREAWSATSEISPARSDITNDLGMSMQGEGFPSYMKNKPRNHIRHEGHQRFQKDINGYH